MSGLTPLKRLALILVTVALGVAAVACLNGDAVADDAAQNVRMAVNLNHQGVISMSGGTPYRPSMYREPLPIALDAILVGVADRLFGVSNWADYLGGKRVKVIKSQNVAWLFLLWVAVIAATHWFTRSFYASILAGVIAAAPFLLGANIEGVNNLYTELPAAALLALAAFALAAAGTEGKTWLFATAGVLYGLLVLTKAVFLYIAPVLFVVLLFTCLVRTTERRRRSLQAVLFVLCFLTVALPWIGRNWHTFAQPQISERGGLAVYTRALMTQMPRDEFRGTFYVWSRPVMRRYLGPILGFGAADLQSGGTLQHLNNDRGSNFYDRDLAAERAGRPEDAITYYRRARAERERLETQYELNGEIYPEVASDAALARSGMRMVKINWRSNLALMIPCMWRGAWLIFPALLLTFGYSLWARRDALMLYIFPGLVYVCFYAILTPFEPRPGLVVRALAVVAVVAVAAALWRRRTSIGVPGLRSPLSA
jgi:4-amino-4-deoxy-L-arabinose transferase-like glycosyltransferase